MIQGRGLEYAYGHMVIMCNDREYPTTSKHVMRIVDLTWIPTPCQVGRQCSTNSKISLPFFVLLGFVQMLVFNWTSSVDCL
jgi:hypothetical protein